VSSIRILFVEAVMRPVVALLAQPRVVWDPEEEPSSPVLVVANHVTVCDVPLILYALPRRARHRVAVAMAAEMLQDWRHARRQGNLFLNLLAPIHYFLVTGLFNVFPLPQEGDFRKAFAHAGRAMDQGFHVLVFPEGDEHRTVSCTGSKEVRGFFGRSWEPRPCQSISAGLVHQKQERDGFAPAAPGSVSESRSRLTGHFRHPMPRAFWKKVSTSSAPNPRADC